MAITISGKGIQVKQYRGKEVLHKIPSFLRGDVVVPLQVTHIQITSFVGCSGITSVTLQDKVKEIKAGAFKHCTNLEKILVTRDNKHFENDPKGVLFTKGRDWLVCAPAKLNGLYVVPNGVKHIENYAFKDCADITTLMLAQSVTSINRGAFENCTGLLHMLIPKNVTKIEAGAFAGCTQLCGVTVASDNANYVTDRDGVLFNKDKTELLYVPATLNGQENTKDGRYVVPEGVTHIAGKAFSKCLGIREILLSDTLQSVAKDAFEGCDHLTTVVAPPGVAVWQALKDCKNLKNRYIRDMRGILYDLDTGKIKTVLGNIVTAHILNGVREIAPKTFANRKLLQKVDIPETLTDIGSCAFAGCENLTAFSVAPGNPVMHTDERGVLFQKYKDNVVLVRAPVDLCGNYRIPDGVTHICSRAFEGCSQLEELIVPDSVWVIQDEAIMDCPNLRRISFLGTCCLHTGREIVNCPQLS